MTMTLAISKNKWNWSSANKITQLPFYDIDLDPMTLVDMVNIYHHTKMKFLYQLI